METALKHITDSVTALSKTSGVTLSEIYTAAEAVVAALKDGKKVMTCGNGGSAAQAIHLAEELVGKYSKVRKPFAAMSLLDSGAMSCIANDFGYDNVFSRQIEALGSEGDVLIAFSTSGRSANIVNALTTANCRQMRTILLTGQEASPCSEHSTYVIRASSNNPAIVQECHTVFLHALVEVIEEGMCI